MTTTNKSVRGLSGWSRGGKVLLTLLVSAACIEGAMAVRMSEYLTNPCAFEESGKFVTLDGGCKDVKTGRVWSGNSYQRTYSDGSPMSFSFNGAKSWCSNLIEGGQSDWRLPTRAEMQAAVANGSGTHLYVPSTPTWSSTTLQGGKYAYVVNLITGEELSRGWATNGQSWTDVVCVR